MRESRNSESKGFAVNNEKLFDIEKGIKPKLPVVAWLADPSGSPVTLVTGCSVTKFDESKLVRTATKAWFPGMEDYLCNVSLPIALRAAASGRRAIVQCAEAQCEMLRSLIATLPYSNNLSVLPADLGSEKWLSDLECLLSELASHASISRLDFVLYESYTADAARPFLPTWEENSDVLGAAIARRVVFFQSVSNYAYDLVLRHGQKEIRVQALTALASFRPAAYLFADAAHKAVSSTFLQSWAREAVHYVDVPISIAELCPGIVDTGLYDSLPVRRVGWDKAELGHAPFSGSLDDDLSSWPMLSPWDIAEVANWYQEASWGQSPKDHLPKSITRLLSAGRDPEVVTRKVKEAAEGLVSSDLPLYAYYPGYPWGSMPPLQTGYAPVFMTPRGQFV